MATVLGLSGLGLAWALYGKRRHQADEAPIVRGLSAFVGASAVDKAYAIGFQRLALPFARAVGWFDRYVIDGLINLSGWLGLVISRRLQRIQTGNSLDYLAAVVVGALLVLVCGAVG